MLEVDDEAPPVSSWHISWLPTVGTGGWRFGGGFVGSDVELGIGGGAFLGTGPGGTLDGIGAQGGAGLDGGASFDNGFDECTIIGYNYTFSRNIILEYWYQSDYNLS